MAVLEVSNLVKDYGRVRAVDHVSLHVEKGEILGLLGPNGAGKTTLINTIMTLEKPLSGRIQICGLDLKEHPRICKSVTGFMPQEVINHGYFTLEEIMFYHAGYYGISRQKNRIELLLKKFSLWEHRQKRVIQLSGGMKRRLLLAKSLIHKPELILLDEPGAGVDVNLRYDIWQLVKDLRNEGKAILFTTHYIEEAERLCDRVAIINKGKLVRHNKTKNLIQECTSRKVLITLKKEVKVSHPCLVKADGCELEFNIRSSAGVGRLFKELAVDWSDVLDVRIQEGTLEDVFKNVLDEKEEA